MITDLYSYILYKSNLINWLYSISESDKFLSTTALKLISDLNNNILSTTPAYDLLFKKYKFKVSLQSVGNGQTLSFVLYQYNPTKNSFTFVGVIKNVTVCACNSEDLPTPTPSPTPTPTPTPTGTATPTPTATSTPTPTPTPNPLDPTPTPTSTSTPTPTPTPGPTDTPTPTPTIDPNTPTPTPTPGPVEPTPTPTPTNTPAPTDTPTPTPTTGPTPTPTPTNTPAPTATPTPTPTITNTPTPSPTPTPTPTPTPDPGIQLFMVGGGGAGGDKINSVVASEPACGGGGAGAYVLTSFVPVAGVSYNFVVGSGGDFTGSTMTNRNGQTTMFADTYYAGGGGGGASYIGGVAIAAGNGVYGGGGGGGGVSPDGTLIAAGSGDGSGGAGGVGVEATDYRVGGSGGGYNSSGVSGQLVGGTTAQGGLGTAVMTVGEVPIWFNNDVDTLIADVIAGSGGGNAVEKTGVVGSMVATAPGRGNGAETYYGPSGRGKDGGMPQSAGAGWGAGNGGGAGWGPYTSGFGGDGFIAYRYPNTWSTPVVTYTGDGLAGYFNYTILNSGLYKILFITITARSTNVSSSGRGWTDGMHTWSGTVKWNTVV